MIKRNKERIWIALFSVDSTAQKKPLNVDKAKVVVMHMVMSAAKYANVIWFLHAIQAEN